LEWIISYWLWWLMTILWPSATPWTTESSWTLGSVSFWFWYHGSSCSG
jgi:hypothetical protein